MNRTPVPAEAELPEAAALADIGELEDLVLEAVARLDDDEVRAPSMLPGWSRGHVVAHLTNLATAFTRQADLAARGEVGEVYDGGPEGRDAAIEAAAPRSADEHLAHLEAALVRLSASWPDRAAGWDAAVVYRSGTLRTILDAWWRELAIHAVDLDAGITAGAWSPELCTRLWAFLSERLPTEPAHVLEGDDTATDEGPPASVGRHVRLVGARRDVLLWLAGRAPVVSPVAFLDDVEVPLPELGPWPGRPPAASSR
ncbi:maleylpyruvate isomerase family mycothiol-dependent enzyme [Sanguibacter sp. 25GB23B1]|uniref:maleylpyruvate isomerase family mycothiol-dependent enzyme n=1 Tax=unclassified Sanguibacter TaxID=2645534 RepID=UPI0032AEC3FE